MEKSGHGPAFKTSKKMCNNYIIAFACQEIDLLSSK